MTHSLSSNSIAPVPFSPLRHTLGTVEELPFAIAGRVGHRIGEELERERRVGGAVQASLHDRDGWVADGGRQHREVLQAIRPCIAVAGVIGRRAIGVGASSATQVDAQAAVGEGTAAVGVNRIAAASDGTGRTSVNDSSRRLLKAITRLNGLHGSRCWRYRGWTAGAIFLARHKIIISNDLRPAWLPWSLANAANGCARGTTLAYCTHRNSSCVTQSVGTVVLTFRTNRSRSRCAPIPRRTASLPRKA